MSSPDRKTGGTRGIPGNRGKNVDTVRSTGIDQNRAGGEPRAGRMDYGQAYHFMAAEG